MNSHTHSTDGSPVAFGRDATGRLSVVMSDGEAIELEAFRDECRQRAVELRQLAIADFFGTAFAALGRFVRRVRRLAVSTFYHPFPLSR